ncbi:BREX-1 system adenine-specific DNA-methyltransferase PglX [Mycobacteroides abscessus]|uniref:BREX-1 system adenine-specific DNA-methyltransferase PglX n=1 Tax=Mycobacteroides abscessus TaxID=36809 RepID=UPI0009258D1F|nr:BREX-1 system adenine-specific DNA-methyltransferase PglX [Mycobacteroides abscessus]SIM51153.1 Type I restriction-modification system methyltransferase subunit [Mycobacteroides abscessus subsp. abscessus]
METAPLKGFATSARTELIREVTARITAVLGQGSPERVESPTTVAGLEKAVAAGGGGDKGKAHVADKVAYTWFNRIIALRFMDANGYTGIGVVSPAADHVGQPEVLAAAKRGQIDTEVVSSDHHMAAIAGLLNGTRQPRPGVDAQAEAYSLLLTAYCQFWHKAMPFMFERQGDFTELLIPANLLAGDSVLNRSVEVLTEDACKDVEVIGWLYQFYISERKDEVFAGLKKNKKAGADEIPAATQLFTPHWIVRYLVENSVGRLWMLNRPDSSLVDQMDYYIAPVDEETDFLKIAKPEELTVIDPACGSGHMLTYAFDLLYAIYEEEGYAPSEIPGLILTHNLYGTEIDPRAGALAAFALTMKATSKRKLFLKKTVEPNICVLEPISFDPSEIQFLVTNDGDRDAEAAFWTQFSEAEILGSLIEPNAGLTAQLAHHLDTLNDEGDMLKAHTIEGAGRVVRQAKYLSERYAVVVANPPYMIAKNMNATLAEWVKNNWPTGSADLYGAFIERCASLSRANAFVAMIAMQSWMFIPSFEELRRRIIKQLTIVTLAQFGPNAFDTINGEVVSTAAFVLRNSGHKSNEAAIFIRLVDGKSESAKAYSLHAAAESPSCSWRYRVTPSDFAQIPGMPLAYWIGPSGFRSFQSTLLGDIASVRTGMTTANNERFLRMWSEVSFDRIKLNSSSAQDAIDSRCKWFPYNKGGGFRRWYGFTESVINWYADGAEIKANLDANGKRRASVRAEEYYFKPAITYSAVSGTSFSARLSDPGFLFDSGGSSVFVEDPEQLELLAGILCSKIPAFFLQAFNETINFQPGDVSRIPVAQLSPDISVQIKSCVTEAVQISRADWDRYETSWGFRRSPVLPPSGVTDTRLASRVAQCISSMDAANSRLDQIELLANKLLIDAYGLGDQLDASVLESEVTLHGNSVYRFGKGKGAEEYKRLRAYAVASDLVSYAVGCMFGRYSLDKSGPILADLGATLQDYLAKVPTPTFMPDNDNVIPIVDGDWFEDDIVGRFREFLRVAFGDENFEENLRFVAASLGVKNLREYFITKAGKSKFYDDHVQRYKKRPIYWLFSSPKGSFNALIYLHRYKPSTASTVLTYLREYVTKLESSLQQAERAGNAKEADRLRKILVELNEYEHDTLYPKASENVAIDLDDGVKVNYPKLGGALRKIAGLESSGD